jgi:hypothetical protein
VTKLKRFSDFISKHSLIIVIISVLLLIPATIGYVKTKINYNILVYLPEDVETIQGQNILVDDFELGAYAFVMVDNMSSQDALNLEEKLKEIDNVGEVFSIYDVIDTSIPYEMLPDEVVSKLYKDDETIIMVTLKGSTSDDTTMEAVKEIRETVKDASKVSSMTAMVLDTRDLSSKEIVSYVVIAVILCLIVLLVATDSYMVPGLLLLNIGAAIIYNMGSNIFLGEISYITKAITAILQLGVTMDFSIFLYHKYEQNREIENNKEKAMSLAIRQTFKSVIGSSLTTFAGFLALCTMDLTLGTDIGIVMAKGVLWGLICVLTLFPSLLLVFDKAINKTKHRSIFPEFKFIQRVSIKRPILTLIIFILLFIPAIIGNNNYQVYYKLDKSLPDDLAFQLANTELASKFNIVSPEIIILDKNIKNSDIETLTEKLKDVEGVDMVISPSSLATGDIKEMLPDDVIKLLDNDKYQLIIINSTYEIASDELNNQLKEVDNIVKEYDSNGIVAGEGALMSDLVKIADHDFKMVNYTSIIVIFIIMILVLKSISLPIILILSIEFAIFLNMACAYYLGTTLPFISSIIVGTIQLGATIDYAILMSTRYLEEREKCSNKKKAMKTTLRFTVPSIITSALCFFAATIGVSVYTQIDMIGSICNLLARGSIISMLVVILILPSLLLIFDKVILKTTILKREGGSNEKNK